MPPIQVKCGLLVLVWFLGLNTSSYKTKKKKKSGYSYVHVPNLALTSYSAGVLCGVKG